MTLSAQIAVGPSRALAATEASLLVGAIVISAATCAARWAPSALLPGVAWSIAGAALLAALLFRYRMRAPLRRFSVGAGVATTWSEDGRLRHGLIDAGTLAWPGFVVLSIREADGRARSARLTLPILCAEQGGDAGRQLRRLVLWLSRSGHAPSNGLDR